MIAAPETVTGSPLLEVNHLNVHFKTRSGFVHAVNDVSFSVKTGSILGIVGESGCGKSATGLSLMRLLPANVANIGDGEVLLEGKDILSLAEKDMRDLRGSSLSMIFQDPMSSLNPVMRIGDQIVEAILAHRTTTKKAAWQQAESLLQHVGIPDCQACLRRYPHELSGGMRQRIMIAIAVALAPKLIIADEPTTALDPTIQAQVLELLCRLVQETRTALILITHDFGVISELADDVVVMYAGRIIERAPAAELFDNPHHPYTVGLLRSIPRLDQSVSALTPIEGLPPVLTGEMVGCPFAPRCDRRIGKCLSVTPVLETLASGQGGDHAVACHNPAANTAIPNSQFDERAQWK
jgi:oligopeptide/dipeptide ABC transporter ATP-binding protein